jgi:hypothetical protein
VDELALVDADAQRVARFFADLMLTLAEGGVGGAESAEAVRALWHATSEQVDVTGMELDPQALVHGLVAVAAAIAGQLAAERGAVGAPGASVVAVWQEVGRALDPADSDGVGSGNGRHDPV